MVFLALMQIVGEHVRVRLAMFMLKKKWLDKLSEQSDSEKDMLDFAFETKSNSRLSCQLILEDKHDGIVVNLPEKQG